MDERGQSETEASLTSPGSTATAKQIASEDIRSLVEGIVRRKVPAQEVDDLVQTILIAALSSKQAPTDPSSLRKWMSGIARHKIADRYRRSSPEKTVAYAPEAEAQSAPISAREWEEWAKAQADEANDGQRTLDWLFREGAGEKLAHIAAEEALPAAMVRKRVSRLRQFFRRQWSRELAAVVVLLLAFFASWRLWRSPETPPEAKLPSPPPSAPTRSAPTWEPPQPNELQAAQLRADAERDCARSDRLALERCLRGLNEAKRLDPAGEAPRYAALRQAANERLKQRRAEQLRAEKKQREQQQRQQRKPYRKASPPNSFKKGKRPRNKAPFGSKSTRKNRKRQEPLQKQ